MATILETAPAPSSLREIVCAHDTRYLKDLLLLVRVVGDCWSHSIILQDLTHAAKQGKTCPRVRIEFANSGHNTGEGFRDLQEFLKRFATLREVFDYGIAQSQQPKQAGSTVSFRLTEVKGVRTFSPFAQFAPLDAAPAKWTIAHVVRALWNGQFHSLQCDGRYTDDYAFDAATNFGKGEIKNARAFCKRLIEDPSGWWASSSGAAISICCHSFDSNSFTADLQRTESISAA